MLLLLLAALTPKRLGLESQTEFSDEAVGVPKELAGVENAEEPPKPPKVLGVCGWAVNVGDCGCEENVWREEGGLNGEVEKDVGGPKPEDEVEAEEVREAPKFDPPKFDAPKGEPTTFVGPTGAPIALGDPRGPPMAFVVKGAPIFWV